MRAWQVVAAAFDVAVVVAWSSLAPACGVPDTNFGPPGGLSGKTLPMPNVPPDSGGMTDGKAMKKCVFKAPPEGGADTGPADTGTDAGEGDAEAGEAGIKAFLAEAGELDGESAGDEGGSGGVTDCKYSWTKDIFPLMGAGGAWECANAACHATGANSPTITSDPTVSYDNLVAYKVGNDMLPFILPCSTDTSKSAFVCVTSGTTCGAQMPVTGSGATALTSAQVDMIKGWIACGAVDN